MTISEKIKDVKFVLANMLDEQERIVYAHENEIVNLNVSAMEDGMGSDGNILKNSNPIFNGVYSLSSQLVNPKKQAGSLYNFFETGEFLRGMQLEVLQNKVQISIFSTGTGSGDKSIFFTGYTNLFGLDNSNSQKVNDLIYKELMIWIRKYI